MKNKAQMNQVFVFLIAMLVIAAIALVGVKSVQSIMDQKCSADGLIFQDRISSATKNANAIKTVNKELISSPCNYKKLCLIDASAIGNPAVFIHNEEFPGSYIIKSGVLDGVKQNVFLINSKNEVLPGGYISQLALVNASAPLCINATYGKYELVLYGKGRTTLVK